MTDAHGEKRRITVRCQFCMTWNRVDAARSALGPKCGKCEKPILLNIPVHLDDETFRRTIAETDVPVLVDFFADWCAPCKLMAPLVDQLAAQYHGRALIAKLDTDNAQNAATPFRITGIPTTIVFLAGLEVARQVGTVPLRVLEDLLNKAGIA